MDFEYFYCDHCGFEVVEPITVPYNRTCASGDICYCPSCEEEVLVGDDWKGDEL